MNSCPNTLPDTECVDPDCVYCKITRAESPRLPVQPQKEEQNAK